MISVNRCLSGLEYFLSPLVLVPPMPGRFLLFYFSVSNIALGCMLGLMISIGSELFIILLRGCQSMRQGTS